MKPYTYLVKLKSTGEFYYGVRYAKNCDPSELWDSYFTSSETIHKLIIENGINAFDHEIRRIFKTDISALRWEQKVISKIINHPLCLNKGYFGYNGKLILSEEERKEVAQRALYTRKNTILDNGKTIFEDMIERMVITRKKNNSFVTGARKGIITKTNTVLENGLNLLENANMKLSKKLKDNPEICKQRTETFRNGDKYKSFCKNTSDRLKIDNPTKRPEVKAKISATLNEYYKHNRSSMFGKTHTEEAKINMSNAKMGDKNPCYNKVWVNNGIKNLRVYEEDIPEGFMLGRLSFKMERKTHECPHCGLIGKGPNMARYHFDNCKKKDL